MADGNNESTPPMAPPPPLPDYVNKISPSSFVPPRPPVFHPQVGATGTPVNPFAPQGFPTSLEKSPLPKAVPPPCMETKAPILPPNDLPRALSIQPPIEIPKPLPPNTISQEKKSSPPKTEVPLTPSPPIISPVTSPAVLPTELPQTIETTKPMKIIEEKKIPEGHVNMSGGLMSWITKTMTESKLLTDVAEKAKYGMEQVLTTLDPGMKGFLSEEGIIRIYTVVKDPEILHYVIKGIEKVFRVDVWAVPAVEEGFAPLVFGSSYATDVCRDRIKRVIVSKQIPTNVPILVFQSFIMNIDNKSYASNMIHLEWQGQVLEAFSHFLSVDENILKHLEARGKADNKKLPDYSITLSQAAKEVYGIEEESWSSPAPPFASPELLVDGLSSLAQKFLNLKQSTSTEKG